MKSDSSTRLPSPRLGNLKQRERAGTEAGVRSLRDIRSHGRGEKKPKVSGIGANGARFFPDRSPKKRPFDKRDDFPLRGEPQAVDMEPDDVLAVGVGSPQKEPC